MVRASLILFLTITAVVAAKKDDKKDDKAPGGGAATPPKTCENEASQIVKLETALEASKKKAEEDTKGLMGELSAARQTVEKAGVDSKKMMAELNRETKKAENAEEDNTKLTNELKAAKKLQCEPFSVVDPIVGSYRFVIDAGTNLLDRSTIDDKIIASASKAYDIGKQATTTFIDKASSVDYAAHMEGIKSHELYRTHVAPHVEKAHSQLKPHLDQHVFPTVEKVTVSMGPHFETAKVHVAAVSKRVYEELVPAVQKHTTKAKDAMYGLPIEKMISPIFEALGKAAPNQAHALPTKTLDRVIILFAVLYVLITGLIWGKIVFRIVFHFARIVFHFGWIAFRVCVLLPLKLTFKVLRIAICIGTCWNCCCLCRKKHKAGDLKTKADNSNDKKAVAGVPATVADMQKLLESVKKAKKPIQESAVQLVKFVKDGKPMEKPDYMKGKTISKDVLLKACGNFKEIDVKKLGL